MDFSIMHPCNNFGMWTVNKKSEECVTLHSDVLEMSYELNIKMECVVPLLQGDIKNFWIPHHISAITVCYCVMIQQHNFRTYTHPSYV